MSKKTLFQIVAILSFLFIIAVAVWAMGEFWEMPHGYCDHTLEKIW